MVAEGFRCQDGDSWADCKRSRDHIFMNSRSDVAASPPLPAFMFNYSSDGRSSGFQLGHLLFHPRWDQRSDDVAKVSEQQYTQFVPKRIFL